MAAILTGTAQWPINSSQPVPSLSLGRLIRCRLGRARQIAEQRRNLRERTEVAHLVVVEPLQRAAQQRRAVSVVAVGLEYESQAKREVRVGDVEHMASLS